MGKAELSFYMNEGLLWGKVNDKPIHLRAASGGGGGVKSATGPDEPGTVNNPLKTRQKKKAGVRGGPLPAGEYTISSPFRHGNLGLCAFLEPKDAKMMGDRGGFFIHGRGKHGSDGCIVPLNPLEFQNLMSGLTKDKGGSLSVQQVYDVGYSPEQATA